MIDSSKVTSVEGVAYGKDPEGTGYFVQTYCNEIHRGQECSCMTIVDHEDRLTAENVATNLAKLLGVDVELWIHIDTENLSEVEYMY